ncbi:MAG: Jag N-terminal domain-containing protein, partial [Actinobacteria bacterium]|nr:Jag N-terminal domain-containing protein [Actinomycetota bacterium]
MDYVEIEIRAKSVDLAIEAAMVEFGVTEPDDLMVEVISEPVKGFLGLGGQDGVYRVKPRRKGRNRRRRGR